MCQDPVYFLKKYCYIQHPMKGKIPFHTWDFQEKTLRDFHEHRYNIILKSVSWVYPLLLGYTLWMMTFHQDKNVLVIVPNKIPLKNLVTKIRVMHANLPSWVKQQCVEDNKLSLRYKNGSQVKAAISSKEDVGRSEEICRY